MGEQQQMTTIPYDAECERLVLGTLLSREGIRIEYGDKLSPESFYITLHETIFRGIQMVANEDKPVNFLTVTEACNAAGYPVNRDDVIDISFKNIIGDAEYYVNRLVELQTKRKIQNYAIRLLQSTQTETVANEESLSIAHDMMVDIETSASNGLYTMGDTNNELLTDIEERRQGKSSRKATKTGFAKIDEKGGLHSSDLIIIAGESSMGKTAWANTVVRQALMQGRKIAFYSMEMKREQLTARIQAMNSRISASRIMYGTLSDAEIDRIKDGMSTLNNENLIFDDKSTSSIDSIEASIRKLHRKMNIDGVVVDYLQIVKHSTAGNRNEEGMLADTTRRLKNIAKELDIFVILLSQLSRDRDNPVPTYSRVRGSGQIVEAADDVYLIYRPEQARQDSYPGTAYSGIPVHNGAWICKAKGRQTGTCEFVCSFIPELTMFVDEIPKFDSSYQPPHIKQSGIPFNPYQTDKDAPF